jgi:hypothetical protein
LEVNMQEDAGLYTIFQIFTRNLHTCSQLIQLQTTSRGIEGKIL